MHTPVLPNEIIEYLDPKPGQKFIDATIDGGGHALSVMDHIGPDGRLLGIEWDGEFLNNLKLKIKDSSLEHSMVLVGDSYVNLKKIAQAEDFLNSDGALFDFGMSSWHLEESGRGFSFQRDEPLDMRFNSLQEDYGLTAMRIINEWREEEIAEILKEYGEETFALKIAAAIVQARKSSFIKSTFQLVEIIKKATPFWYRSGRRIHFATKTFQALRVAVNGEFENMRLGMAQAIDVLRPGGRLAAISFHSIEDRIVKNFLRDRERSQTVRILTKKPVQAKLEEREANPRSRSAKLRVAEKIK